MASQRRAFGPAAVVEHVEDDVLALAEDQDAARPEHHPDIGDRAELQRPGDRVVEDVAADDLDDEGAEHQREQCRADLVRAPRQAHRSSLRKRAAPASGIRPPALLMRSSMPLGQSWRSPTRGTSPAPGRGRRRRRASSRSCPCPRRSLARRFSVPITPSSLTFLAASSAASIAACCSSREAVPEALGEGEEDVGHHVAGQHHLLDDLVELGRDGVGQRVLEPVDGAGLHREVDFLEGQRRGIGASALPRNCQASEPGMRSFSARHVGRRLDSRGWRRMTCRVPRYWLARCAGPRSLATRALYSSPMSPS